jgi:hypothetical protein
VTIQLRLPTKSMEKGVVYTKPWVVDLILDFVGYRPTADLASLQAVEPAAGEGAFLGPMVHRLAESMRRHNRTLEDARTAIRAYEIDSDAADYARQLVVEQLMAESFSRRDAGRAAHRWVCEVDYLLGPEAAPADVVIGNPPYIGTTTLTPACSSDTRQCVPRWWDAATSTSDSLRRPSANSSQAEG